MTCKCVVCSRRQANGQDPFPGISLSVEQHITEEDAQPRPLKPRALPPPPPISRADLLHANNEMLMNAVGDALAAVIQDEVAPLRRRIEELELQTDSKVGDLEWPIRGL
jgi:hypothetical protein